jgi:hypothetical protein
VPGTPFKPMNPCKKVQFWFFGSAATALYANSYLEPARRKATIKGIFSTHRSPR